MLTKAQTQPVRDMLQAAQWHFEDDEKRLGSQKIWDAAVAALTLIAEERGWACESEDDRWDIIERLHAEFPELWLGRRLRYGFNSQRPCGPVDTGKKSSSSSLFLEA